MAMAGCAVAGCAAIVLPAMLSTPGPTGAGTDLLVGALMGGTVLLTLLPFALALAQRARSYVCVDRAAGTVTVRVARGLRLGTTVLPLECLTACAIQAGQERIVPSGSGSVIGLINLGIALAAPRYRTTWSIVLCPGRNATPVLVTPRRALEPYRLLPLARRLTAALGCALDTPFDPDMAQAAAGFRDRPPP